MTQPDGAQVAYLQQQQQMVQPGTFLQAQQPMGYMTAPAVEQDPAAMLQGGGIPPQYTMAPTIAQPAAPGQMQSVQSMVTPYPMGQPAAAAAAATQPDTSVAAATEAADTATQAPPPKVSSKVSKKSKKIQASKKKKTGCC